jgi:hypothetical protein
MNNRFWQWMALQEGFDRHCENAGAALDALDGRDTIVNRHLLRIVQRENALAEFALCLSTSQAYDHFDFEEKGQS